jgi:hypothetical protein
MFCHQSLLFAILVVSAAALRPIETNTGLAGFKPSHIIIRDVAIIGGGSAGTHAAISLKDKGYTSVVIEKKPKLGGHTETYYDPLTGAALDYGVVIFHNEDLVRTYFSRFNITLTQNIPTLHTSNFDLRNGKRMVDDAFTPEQIAKAIQKYGNIISQWPDLDNGMFLPEPVPEDLVMPLGAFAKKHGIEAMIPMFSQLNPGSGDLLLAPMVEHLRVVGLSLLRSLAAGFLTTENHANHELYERAQAELLAYDSVLLDSEVLFAKRSEADGIRLQVMTPQGKRLVVAKKLLVTIPPKVSSIENLNLSHRETSVFSKFVNAGYYTSIINNTGIPATLSIYNSDPLMPFEVAQLPSVFSIQETHVPGLHTVYYGTPRSPITSLTNDASVQAAIIQDLKRLQTSNTRTFTETEPNFVAFSSHTPFYLQASAVNIKQGFYKDLYELQGVRNTYWSGASWRSHDSSSIWRFNEQIVLPQLVKALQSSPPKGL